MDKQEIIDYLYSFNTHADITIEEMADDLAIPSAEPKKCKDCKWWKDSDGTYRRGVHAESQCPINRREVLEGNGYCYVYEPQESEDKCKNCKYYRNPDYTRCHKCKAESEDENDRQANQISH